MNYSTSLTKSYKCGFFHLSVIDNNEIVRVQVDPYAYAIQVKSIRAAKQLITKHLNSGRALVKRRGAK